MVRKKLLHQNTFFFRIKFGKKLSNSLISGKTAYKFILKSEGQQSLAKPMILKLLIVAQIFTEIP